jgi:hypothetical protein
VTPRRSRRHVAARLAALVVHLGIGAAVGACTAAPASPQPTRAPVETPSPRDTPSVLPSMRPTTFLPLGDSYTIGTSVGEADRWPDQLAELLAERGHPLSIVANPAVNGYTSGDLIRD